MSYMNKKWDKNEDIMHGHVNKTTNGGRMISYEGPVIWNKLSHYRK